MTVSLAIAIIGAAAVLALGGIGATAVAGMARADDSSHIYGGLVLSTMGVIFMAALAFAAAFFIK